MRASIAVIVAVLAIAAPALAEDGDILQIKQTFDPAVADVAVGGVLHFVNADDVNHNLVLVAPDGTQTDRGLDKPGETTDFAFPAAGVYSVICHIHPRMKIKVTVHAAS
jgi:plastocyanin